MTLPIPTLTPEQRRLARHALGLGDRRKKRAYRNRYNADEGSDADRDWSAMVDLGAALRVRRKDVPGVLYILTIRGALAAMESHEMIDAEELSYMLRAEGLLAEGGEVVSKHTPEPWTVHGPARPTPDAPEGGDYCIKDSGGYVIAETFYRVSAGADGTRDARANIHLFAASPAMLELLKHIAEVVPVREFRDRALAIIRRIEGDEQPKETDR